MAAQVLYGVARLGHDRRHHRRPHRHTTGATISILLAHNVVMDNLFYDFQFHKYVYYFPLKLHNVMPQGIAYAIVAGLPPQYGLYSAYLGCFVYCLLGRWKGIDYYLSVFVEFVSFFLQHKRCDDRSDSNHGDHDWRSIFWRQGGL